ncbi:MAG: cytochrome c oxidase subunit II [Rhodospirillales bacterium]|jgi:cytochrome c oxidase subunit II|nr:cytochrome c oxidase subunit II [Rhodospirillales bacterium]
MKRMSSVVAGITSLVAPLAANAQDGVIQDPAEGWDNLWYEMLVDITVIGVVFMIAAIYMLIRYRTKDPDAVGRGPKLTKAQAIAWVLIPASIFMADDFFLSAKGWSLWNIQRGVPDNALEIKVTGYQWYWEFEYENGVILEELIVPIGQPVVLRMTGEDVIHSFGLPEYRIKEDVMPGRVTYLWFYPKEAKETVVTCTEFCGVAHSEMYTRVAAIDPMEYEALMAKEVAEM